MFSLGHFRDFVRQSEWWLFICPILIVGLGLIVLYSISAVRTGGELFLFKKQLVIAIVGIFIALAVSAVDYRIWRIANPILYLITLGFLVAVLMIGQRINATRGWIGFESWRFQPVEIVKFTLIIALAAYFARRARALNHFVYLIQSFILVLLPVALVVLQPDFGSAAILLAVWIGLILIIGIKRQYVIALFFLLMGSLFISWSFFFAPYQRARLTSFFFPTERTAAQNYNVRQAIIAIGSGELTGRGLGAGPQSQLKFLPEAGTDFIFAVIGEELGFVGIAVLLVLLGFWNYRLFRLLFKCRDDFASFVILGTVILIFAEIFVNAGMAMGLFPVVGIPFPFLSAGGSSLLAHFILLGVVAAIARQESATGYQISRVSVV